MKPIVLVAMLLVASAPGAGSIAAVAEATLVPVIGSWRTDVEAGQSVVTVDGSGRTPATGPAAAQIAQLFGSGHEAFLRIAQQTGAFPLAIAREVADVREGVIRVQFKLIGGASDQTAGIAFNMRPDGSYHFARYNTKDGNLAVWTFKDGVRTVQTHGEAHKQLPLGDWHDLAVTIKGTSISATSSGGLSVTHTLSGPVQGRVGVWTKADSVTAFRRFDVTPSATSR